jgi:hypothetical protein
MSESTGIGIGVGVGVVVTIGILVTAGAIYTGKVSEVSAFITPFMFAIANFIPFGLIVFGFIADMIGQEFRFSIASMFGILSIILNKIAFGPLANLYFKAPPDAGLPAISDTGHIWCFIPGLEALESKSLPMNFTVMGTIMMYYLIFALTNRDISMNGSLIASFLIFPIVQGLAFYGGGCSQWYSSGPLGNAIAWVIGIILGATAYGIVNAVDPSRSPFGYHWGSGDTNAAAGWQGTRKAPVGGAPPTGAKCTAADTDDNNAFVCEAYKNGVLVTEKIS